MSEEALTEEEEEQGLTPDDGAGVAEEGPHEEKAESTDSSDSSSDSDDSWNDADVAAALARTETALPHGSKSSSGGFRSSYAQQQQQPSRMELQAARVVAQHPFSDSESSSDEEGEPVAEAAESSSSSEDEEVEKALSWITSPTK